MDGNHGEHPMRRNAETNLPLPDPLPTVSRLPGVPLGTGAALFFARVEARAGTKGGAA